METSKKKIIIITSIIAVVLVAIIGAIVYLSMSSLKVVDDFTIEYGENISNNVADYLIKGTDKKIIDNATVKINDIDKELDFPDVGDYTVEVCYKNQTKKVIVTVKDTTPPVFIDQNDVVNIFTNETVNYQELFDAEDLSGVIIPLEVDDSEVDYSKAGTYTLTVKATDGYGNHTTKEVTLNITQTSLSINTNSVSIKKGNTYQLQSTVVGRENATYTSSNNSVATVDGNGKIVGVGKGTTKVLVEANGLTCEVEVTVVSSNSGNKNNNSSSNNGNSNSSSGGSQEEDTSFEDLLEEIGGSTGPEGDPDDDMDDNDDFVVHG